MQTTEALSRPARVFISYSHDSDEHRERVLALADRLREDGLDAELDQYEAAPPEGWPRWMCQQIETADFVLVICTATYASRFLGQKDASGQGLGVSWEGSILTLELYRSRSCSSKIVPVVFSPGDLQHIPLEFSGAMAYALHTENGYEDLYRRLTDQPRIRKPPLGRLRSLPPPERPSRFPNDHVRELSSALDAAYQRWEKLLCADQNTEQVGAEILELRRRLREGGQLQAGDFLFGSRFTLIKQLGRGGFAAVWKAFDRESKSLVAVKVLHGQHADDRTLRDRFFRGARTMANLQHQGIVRVIEPKIEDGDRHFFVMEYVSGGDLHKAIVSQLLSRQQGFDTILQVGAALDYAHQQGLIHRDVKPANILLDHWNQPKLTDFDLVWAFDTTGGTQTASMLGTFLYAAPECLDNPKDVTVAADIFSLGMCAIFVIYGRDLPQSIVMRHPNLFIEDLDCDVAVQGILKKAVSWEVKERFDSVPAFCSALRRATTPVMPGQQSRPSRVNYRGKRLPSLRKNAIVLATILLLLVVITAWLTTRDSSQETSLALLQQREYRPIPMLAGASPPSVEIISPRGGDRWLLPATVDLPPFENITWKAVDNSRICRMHVALQHSKDQNLWISMSAGGGLPRVVGSWDDCLSPGKIVGGISYRLPLKAPSGMDDSFYRIEIRAINEWGLETIAHSGIFFIENPTPQR